MPDGPIDDDALVMRVKSGDLDAFAEIVRRYEDRVRGVLFRLLDDERDVEEATQDSFVQAWRNLHRFRGDATVFTWLYRIAVNEALARLRRKRLPVTGLEEGEPSTPVATDPSTDPHRAAEREALQTFLAGRIRALTPEHRAALVLRDLVGLSNQEVADVLDVTVAAPRAGSTGRACRFGRTSRSGSAAPSNEQPNRTAARPHRKMM